VHNDKALRVVSGAASSGGSSAFSTVFGKTAVDATTLSVTQMPSHGHGVSDPGHGHPNQSLAGHSPDGGPYGIPANEAGTTGAAATGISIAAQGGGGSHVHGMDIRVQYVDIIIATKD
jgi:hypothetical protein